MAFMNEMLNGFAEIFSAPFKSIEVLWLIIPLILLWITLEIYFARYRNEKLGWNTALANGITLGWITLEALRHLFDIKPDDFFFRFITNLVILLYASLIIYLSFTHKIRSKWNFILAAPSPIYFLSIFSVAWGYGTLEISRYVILDLAILFIIVLILSKILRKIVKPSEKDKKQDKSKSNFADLDKEAALPDIDKNMEGFPPLEKI